MKGFNNEEKIMRKYGKWKRKERKKEDEGKESKRERERQRENLFKSN